MIGRLDSRLEAVAEFVRNGSIAADIGTDHGYLICHLVSSGKCPRGYASDINVQPLEAAQRHITQCALQDRIETVLSNGLDNLPGEDIDDIIIAGMGGELIAEILSKPDWIRDIKRNRRFILQPMTKADALRRSLYRMGFCVLDERAVRSGRFIYTVMNVKYTAECTQISGLFAHTGLLLDKQDDLSRKYIAKILSRLKKQWTGMQSASSPAGEMRVLEDLIKAVQDSIKGGV